MEEEEGKRKGEGVGVEEGSEGGGEKDEEVEEVEKVNRKN